MHITVIGCGVSGLSSAIRLQEAGHTVQIWACDLPPHTTSNIAAAVWYPYKAFPEELVLAWSAATYRAFDALTDVPAAAVRLIEGVELFPYEVADPWWKSAVPSFRRASKTDLLGGAKDGYLFQAHVVEMDRYLPYLMARFETNGGTIVQRNVASLTEAFAEADALVNCSGLGARELVHDTTMLPIRGQIVRVSQVGIEHFIFDDHGPGGVTYIVPRSNDIILGGTAQEGATSLEVDPETAHSILTRCALLDKRLERAEILEHRVGLRPGRPTVRLERGDRNGHIVVHNYGHGGAGVTLSWGCADQVVALIDGATNR